ncbi:MAG: hypothetical protein J0I41_10200 [Filimonas sp.]|nr:hypothetical protein [Filimonas sp.]
MLNSKNVLWILLVAAATATSCKKNVTDAAADGGKFNRSVRATTPDNRPVPTVSKNIPNVISSDLTLDKDTLWYLNGPTYVTNGAKLTIEAGSFIKGKRKVNVTNNYPSFLMVTRGSQLIANGTDDAPIVFTSEQPAGSRNKGDWGGIVLLGNGHTNSGVMEIEGIQQGYVTSFNLPFPSTIEYGDNTDEDNSGSLKYVRIEFAGDVITEGNELNGLTLGAVGYLTTLEHIQVSNGADDGFEFFGGAVNAKYLVSFGNDDDDLDFDQGYQGSIQFAVAVKNPALGFSSSPNGIESNNITSPVVVTDPSRKTRPILSNLTILGTNTTPAPPSGVGTLFRVNSDYVLRNSIIGGFNTGSTLLTASVDEYYNNIVHGFTTSYAPTSFPPAMNVTAFVSSNTNNDLLLVDPFTLSAPDFRYVDDPFVGTSPAGTVGTNFTSLTVTHPGGALSAFTSTAYVGAFPSQNDARWDDTWASYSPNANTY